MLSYFSQFFQDSGSLALIAGDSAKPAAPVLSPPQPQKSATQEDGGRKSPDPLNADLEAMPVVAVATKPLPSPVIGSQLEQIGTTAATATQQEPMETSAAETTPTVKEEDGETADSVDGVLETSVAAGDSAAPAGVGRKRWYEGCSYVCMACRRSYDIYFSYHGHIKKIHDLSMEQYHARYRQFYANVRYRRYRVLIPATFLTFGYSVSISASDLYLVRYLPVHTSTISHIWIPRTPRIP